MTREIKPTESRVFATPGEEALLPIESVDPLPERVAVKLSDGKEIVATTCRVLVNAGSAARSWLPPSGEWTVARPGESVANGAIATTYLLVPMPGDSDADGIVLGGATVPLTWLARAAASSAPAPAPPAALDRLLLPELRSPVRRWRYKLVTRTLLADDSAVPEFEDPILESLARQQETRWRHALSRLGREDARLAARVVARIGRLITFSGQLVPAWPTSLADLEALLAVLIDPARPREAIVAAAEAFLEGQRVGLSWVSDDAGAQSAADRSLITAVACLNLDDRPLVASCAWTGAASGADLVTLPPASARVFRLARSDAASTGIEARVGPWKATLATLPLPIAARPPGVVIGPLERDWTLEGLYSARPETGTPAGIVRIYRSSESADWTLYAECARAAPVGAAAREEYIRVWLGPTGRSRAVLTISERGELQLETQRAGLSGGPTALAISEPGRWAATLQIPSAYLEGDATLLVGIERFDAAGERTSAPRAMLPWQQEPGRVAIDTRAW